ncbi:MAG: diguanylate cyclase [Pseudomonadota bacterium]
MHGKLLIVDPVPTQRIALKVKLATAFYEVCTAPSLADAINQLSSAQFDLVLCAHQLTDGDPGRLVRRMSALGLSDGVPVLAIGMPAATEDRYRLLQSGVADIVEARCSDARLLATVRSLIRAYGADAEWTAHDAGAQVLGLAEPAALFQGPARISVIGPTDTLARDWTRQMQSALQAQYSCASLHTAMASVADAAGPPDLFVLALCQSRPDVTLAMLTAIRAHRATRHSAVLVVKDEAGDDAAARALDLGADRVMQGGFDAAEVALRVRSLLARKQRLDQLRSAMRRGVEAALIDPLTGLHNRRYALPHLQRTILRAHQTGRPLAVMVADLDHFKAVNDTYGHSAGDAVLVEAAARLRDDLRPMDMIARIGGEEFLIVMPGIGLKDARQAAKRLCRTISGAPFVLPQKPAIRATISIGLAVAPAGSLAQTAEAGQALIDQADRALYDAKTRGRNCVRIEQPAA